MSIRVREGMEILVNRGCTNFVIYFLLTCGLLIWLRFDANQPNTKHNHANDPLEVPIGPITRARAKKLKEALNGLIQNIWSKIDLEGLGTFKEHERHPLIHPVQVQEEHNSCGTRS